MQRNDMLERSRQTETGKMDRFGLFLMVWTLCVLVLAVRLAVIGEINRFPVTWLQAFLATAAAWLYWVLLATVFSFRRKAGPNIDRLSVWHLVAVGLPVAFGAILWSAAAELLLLPGTPSIADQIGRRLLPELIWNVGIYAVLFLWLFGQKPDILATQPGGPTTLAVREGSRVLILSIAEIRLVRAQDYYAEILTTSGPHIVREPLYKLSKTLEPHGFARVNRSTIARLSLVRKIGPLGSFGFGLELDDGTRLKVGRTYRHALKSRIRSLSG